MGLSVSIRKKQWVDVWDQNITHNLTTMAREAELYKALWHPEELQIQTAEDLIPYLERGLSNLRINPDKFRKLNPPNGWGTYENLVNFVERYLSACKEYPNGKIEADR